MHVMDRVSLRDGEGAVLGLIGESGSGKSTLALARQIPASTRITGEAVPFEGEDRRLPRTNGK